MIYLRLLGKGFSMVALVAMQTRQIAAGRFGPSFVVGFAISSVWWFNSRSASHSDAPGAWAAYALGAGFGTVAGMWLGGHTW